MIYLQDIKLKAVILEFIATAVETQPGLIELFLDLTYKDNKVHDSFIFNKIFRDHYKELSCRPNLPSIQGLFLTVAQGTIERVVFLYKIPICDW